MSTLLQGRSRGKAVIICRGTLELAVPSLQLIAGWADPWRHGCWPHLDFLTLLDSVTGSFKSNSHAPEQTKVENQSTTHPSTYGPKLYKQTSSTKNV